MFDRQWAALEQREISRRPERAGPGEGLAPGPDGAPAAANPGRDGTPVDGPPAFLTPPELSAGSLPRHFG